MLSVPKAGTHLLETILCMHPQVYRPFVPTLEPRNVGKFGGLERVLRKVRPGHLYVSHFPYSDEVLLLAQKYKIKLIFLKRDPRAVLVSDVHYIDKRKDHYLHAFQRELSGIKDKVRLQLRGVAEVGLAPFADRLDSFIDWEAQEGVLTVRFEDLIGADQERLAIEYKRLFDFISAEISDEWLLQIQQSLPTESSPTFRPGGNRGWQNELPSDLIREVEDCLGDRLERSGYHRSADVLQRGR